MQLGLNPAALFYFYTMAVNTEVFEQIKEQLNQKGVMLVAVSKIKPPEDILALYQRGQKDFGENYVQEMVEKEILLPKDIRWHFIGHLQSNKVKYIAPFVYLIHGVDSLKLLTEISKQALKAKRTIKVLLQIHIAREATKFGLDEKELKEIMEQWSQQPLPNVEICGLMGMASYSDDKAVIQREFQYLKSLFDQYKNDSFALLSMGMSSDYEMAIENGSNAVRIGSLLFGARAKKN